MAGFPTNGEISRHRIAYTGSVSPAALSFRAMIHDAAIPAFAQTAKALLFNVLLERPIIGGCCFGIRGSDLYGPFHHALKGILVFRAGEYCSTS